MPFSRPNFPLSMIQNGAKMLMKRSQNGAENVPTSFLYFLLFFSSLPRPNFHLVNAQLIDQTRVCIEQYLDIYQLIVHQTF